MWVTACRFISVRDRSCFYLLYQGNHTDLTYRGGQEPIVHLQADLRACVTWADQHGKRWAFTLSNAGAYYFENRCDLKQLHEINWQAVRATHWQACKEGKQAEFLLECSFPWHLIERIGVYSQVIYQQVANALPAGGHRPQVQIKKDWYY
ncbi:DUF4433 domain-containing protein [Synechococcus sp. PCC 7336]|uniref:DUF4433 domain-containing protein n=1 Tax=Synechococcus sp. PCC 7336 TaxID=195250 RepID=UPI000345EEE8|nr:DUF4433 domain-containing protein [Synechococcus sp. PCC 7336]